MEKANLRPYTGVLVMNNDLDAYRKLEEELMLLSHDIIKYLEQTAEIEYQQLLKKLEMESVMRWPELMSDVYSPQLRQQKQQLEKLEAALSQIQIGMYGLCADCEAPIEKHLLEQDYTRQRCLRCQAKF